MLDEKYLTAGFHMRKRHSLSLSGLITLSRHRRLLHLSIEGWKLWLSGSTCDKSRGQTKETNQSSPGHREREQSRADRSGALLILGGAHWPAMCHCGLHWQKPGTWSDEASGPLYSKSYLRAKSTACRVFRSLEEDVRSSSGRGLQKTTRSVRSATSMPSLQNKAIDFSLYETSGPEDHGWPPDDTWGILLKPFRWEN